AAASRKRAAASAEADAIRIEQRRVAARKRAAERKAALARGITTFRKSTAASARLADHLLKSASGDDVFMQWFFRIAAVTVFAALIASAAFLIANILRKQTSKCHGACRACRPPALNEAAAARCDFPSRNSRHEVSCPIRRAIAVTPRSVATMPS